MTKRMTTFLFTLLLLIGMTTTMTQAQESGVELVMGGAMTTYATFDEAVAAFNTSAETDGTINLVEGQTYASIGYNLIGKNLIVNGNGATLNVVGDTTSPEYLVMTANGFATYNQITLNVSSTSAKTQAFLLGLIHILMMRL